MTGENPDEPDAPALLSRGISRDVHARVGLAGGPISLVPAAWRLRAVGRGYDDAIPST
jgi:hypothetical protein